MADNNHYKHWRIETDSETIAWLHCNKDGGDNGEGTNVLNAEVIAELDAILDELRAVSPRGVVILSDKRNGFIAGADVNAFTTLQSETEALALIHTGQALMDKIEALPFPTVALVHGFCLGGGLELALACRYRVVDNAPRTRLGLPEVRLGIHPGFGGTLRLIRRIGAPQAMDLMLSGRTVSASAARKLRLVDYSVSERDLRTAARHCVLTAPADKPLPWWLRLASQRRVRPWLAKYLLRQVAQRAPRAHYPAPYALIDLWLNHFDDPKRMLHEEATSVAHLIVGKTAQNLVRVFQLQERLKSLGKAKDFTPRHVHVIGAGVMGGDIAAWCALQGLNVTVQDQNKETLARMVQRAAELYRKRLKHHRPVQAALDRLVPDEHGHGLARADVVIEAIFEDVEVKQALFRSIEPRLRPEAILATNTSSIPLEELGKALDQPQRLVGLHFFNPVAKMQLVEVVHGEHTGADVLRRAAAFARQIDRLPLPVTSTPGFLVNRILMPYLMEAVTLADEGVPLALIDKAAVDFGMPMGPIELADTVGLDICLKVGDILAQHMDITVPERLRQLVQRGRLGRKSGAGFYDFKRGRPAKPTPPKNYTAPTDIQDRLILRLVNEAVVCLADHVVEDEALLDAGVIFGTGFAPFRGGPLHYVHARGAAQLLKTLDGLHHRHGPRFTAGAGWTGLQTTSG